MNLHQAVTDFIAAYDREGIQSPELAEKLGKVREAIADIEIGKEAAITISTTTSAKVKPFIKSWETRNDH